MIGNKSGLEGPPFGISINFIILILSNGTTIERGFCLKSPQLKNDQLKIDLLKVESSKNRSVKSRQLEKVDNVV